MSFSFPWNVLCRFCLILLLASSALGQDSSSFAPASSSSGASISNISVEKIKQQLAMARAAIARSPNDPRNYIDLAYALTDAGVGDQARQEAARATAAAPQSSFAYNAQAWVLRHNIIGVDFGKGFDYDASLASYHKAIQLAPDDMDPRESLANLLERSRDGIHYSPEARLGEAINTYLYIKAHQNPVATSVEDNLLIVLFYAGEYKEALAEASALEPSLLRNGVTIASIAALKSPAAAVDFANQIGGDEQKKKDALNFAAEGLWNMRLYPQAAALLTASLPDPSGSKTILGKIQIFSNLKPYQGPDLPPTDARSPVQQLIFAALTNSLNEEVIARTLSSHTSTEKSDPKNILQQAGTISSLFWNLSRQTGLPQVVIQDIVLSNLKITAEPSTEPGSRINVQAAGIPAMHCFVLSEDGSQKIIASDGDLNTIAAASLYLSRHDQQPEAVSLLNWKRDLVQREQGDDPLGGLLFARLWKSGTTSSPQSIELAAASLSSDPATLATLLPHVVSARQSATADTERDNLDLLLASMYLQTNDAANAKSTAQQLLARYPDSTMAATLAGRAYSLTQDWVAWKALIQGQLQKHPADRLLLLQNAAEAEAERDFPRARKALRLVMDGGRATADDYNMYAWLSLFEDKVDDDAVSAAEQANLMTRNSNYAYLHTLACLDAAQGKVAEARQLLDEAMYVGRLQEPNSALWYAFGLVYERYGISDAAAAAYTKVKKAESAGGSSSPIDPFVLAQSRLKALSVSSQQSNP